jgi:uncharacterized protein YceK
MKFSWIDILLIVVCLVFIIVLVTGCSSWGTKVDSLTSQKPVETAKERFVKTVKSVGWLVLFAIVGVAVSAFALFNGNKWALGSLAGSIAMLGLSLMVSRYAELLAFITLICTLAGVGFLIYSIVIKKKAISELVTTVEKLKDHVPGSAKITAFKDESNPDSAVNVQSNTTKKIVDDTKKKLNGKLK